MGIFSKLFGTRKPDALSAEQLFEILVEADVSATVAEQISNKIRSSNPQNFDALRAALTKYIADIVRPLQKDFAPIKNSVIMLTGVNGAGKTTTIGKLVNVWQKNGFTIEIGACDTFRAAATEQLREIANRIGAPIICGENADPASVAYKTVESQQTNGSDIAVLDTAGRLQTRTDLMDELPKIIRVVKKIKEDAPNEIWLVLDGTTGQNMLSQIEHFGKTIPLSGLIITKLDGTSKSGGIISYAANTKNPLPIYYTANGEGINDIAPFNADKFAERLTEI